MSIRLRLTLWYSCILAVTLLLFGVALYFFLSINLYSDLKSQLKREAEKVRAKTQLVAVGTENGVKVTIMLPDLDAFQSPGIYLQAVSTVNGEIWKSNNLGLIDLPVSKEMIRLAERREELYQTFTIGKASLLIYSTPLMLKNNLAGILQVATRTDTLRHSLDSLQYTLMFAGLATVLLASLFGWFLARKALKPIDHVIEAANRIEKGADLERRILYEGPDDEIGRLTKTINGMLARIQAVYSEIEESYRAQRRFVSDASHELRTPLTTIRGNVDLLEKIWKTAKEQPSYLDTEKMELSLEAMRDIAGEAERMSRLVNDLLSLARADAGYAMEKQRVELKPLVEEVARRAQFLPRKADWRVGDLDALNGVTVDGNKDYLQQLLFIFIENAFKYTPEGHVRMDALRAGDQIGIRISDTGIGMDKDEVPLIFERFYRADPSRGKTSGTGLGLSIAKWIIDEHGGSIEVKTRLGEGTTFVIWLPVSFPPSLQ